MRQNCCPPNPRSSPLAEAGFNKRGEGTPWFPHEDMIALLNISWAGREVKPIRSKTRWDAADPADGGTRQVGSLSC